MVTYCKKDIFIFLSITFSYYILLLKMYFFKEDNRLIIAVNRFSIRNRSWNNISREVATRSPRECRNRCDHDIYYIINVLGRFNLIIRFGVARPSFLTCLRQ